MKRKHGTTGHHSMGKKNPPKANVHRKDHSGNGKRGGAKRTSRLTGMKI